MSKKWKTIHECDDANGNPTCWVLEINHEDHGKWIWITLNSNKKYNIEIYPNQYYTILATCKSLSSAKNWVKRNIL